MNRTRDGFKRYNLVLPEEMFNEIKKVAEAQQTSMVEVMRKFIKFGLMVSDLAASQETSLFIKKHGEEQKIILL